MKKLEKDILIKIIVPFFGMLFLFLLTIYGLFREFTLEVLSNKTLSVQEIMSEFNFIWIEVILSLFIVLIVSFFFLKKLKKKLLQDLYALSKYLEEISQNKNYEAILHIKHYIEFLHISIQLKNIIKRVYKKNKK